MIASGTCQMYSGRLPEKPSSSSGFMATASVGCVAAAPAMKNTASASPFQ